MNDGKRTSVALWRGLLTTCGNRPDGCAQAVDNAVDNTRDNGRSPSENRATVRLH
jgi:hypothetical protein